MNHIPDKYEHLVRYYGYYSNCSRGARLIQKVYEVDRLECQTAARPCASSR